MKNLLLSLFAVLAFIPAFAQTAPCSELFFSVYYEGAYNDKALEIYNPTASPISLKNYTLEWYDNGATAFTNRIALDSTKSVPAYGSFLVTSGVVDSQHLSGTTGAYTVPPTTDSLRHVADQLADTTYPTVFYFNGNDALSLSKSGTIVDIFGKIGQDPGKSWSWDSTSNPPYTNPTTGPAAKNLTYHFALVRKHTVKQGVTVNPVNYFNALAEYDSTYYKKFAYSTGFHSHVCDCKTTGINETVAEDNGVQIFPNPTNNGNIFVQAKENINDVTIYNIIGAQVSYNVVNNNNKIQLSTGRLTAGTYLVSTRLQSGVVEVKKLIVE